MKTINMILVLFLFFITACQKEENNGSNGDPVTFSVYIELLKPDGTSFEEGEVEAKGGYIDKEGRIIYQPDWFQLPINLERSEILEKTVFGPFELGIGWEHGEDPEEGTQWATNQLLLLSYEGISKVDTLRCRDSMNYPEFRYFDIFKNDTLVQRFNDPDNYVEQPWYITIQK